MGVYFSLELDPNPAWNLGSFIYMYHDGATEDDKFRRATATADVMLLMYGGISDEVRGLRSRIMSLDGLRAYLICVTCLELPLSFFRRIFLSFLSLSLHLHSCCPNHCEQKPKDLKARQKETAKYTSKMAAMQAALDRGAVPSHISNVCPEGTKAYRKSLLL